MACIYGVERSCDECRMCSKESHRENKKKITNADRIRGMSNAELARFLCKVKEDYQWKDHEFPSGDACGDWEEWLESEGEEGV